MRSESGHRRAWLRVGRWVAAATLLAWGVSQADAQQVRIRLRPLTPQEIKDYGLPAATQKSGGGANAGIGQPIYFEALVTNGLVVNAVNWSLVSKPPTSAADLEPSPLGLSIPTYDGGDRIGYTVAGRAMLRPDKLSYFDFGTSNIVDYKVRTEVVLSTGTLNFTNSAYGATYLGREHYLCVLCHSNKQTDFTMTDHATAFSRQITGAGSDHFNPNCISCHTLGYDTTPGAVNDGFDDIAAALVPPWAFPPTLTETNWTLMDPALRNKANVQCESCHGPASTHMTSLGRTNAIDISLSAGTCGQCHDSKPFHVKAFEWGQSMHATGYVFRFSGTCIPCHSAKGFVETHDPAYAGVADIPRDTSEGGMSCAGCHDPHTVGMGEYQLRNITNATLLNGAVITRAVAGDGVLCMNCHRARADSTATIAGPANSRFGPHHGPQADMLMATNGYHYGLQMPSSRHLTAVENSCIGCHMQTVSGTEFGAGNTEVGGHTFKMVWDNNTPGDPMDDMHVTAVCSQCHVERGTFDFGGEDYDRDGSVEGVQTEIHGLLEQLSLLLPPVGSTTITPDGSYTLAQKRALWNYLFVEEDQSHGVHNPKYASALLRASIDDLTGGIDIDQDGLVDSWEMANFGSLTVQTGLGDYDGDGVSNALEEEIGTNPKVADSDLDGFNDLAELQAGTNPMLASSMPPGNTVIQMLPALELGYMPDMVGVTQKWQSVNLLGSGGWTDVGSPFVSSASMAYQLISLRDSTQKYFRVVAP